MKQRLDVVMTKKGLARSRTAAAVLIETGKVLVNGVIVGKASAQVEEDAEIVVTEQLRYVSRAGDKLQAALDTFNIIVAEKTALDIGSSTGGFTDCLLQHGATKVYAVDVGTDQLDAKLREDRRVVVMEKQDARTLTLQEKVDLIVVDVSFISLEHIIPLIPKFLRDKGEAVLLIKPQFEVGQAHLNRQGVVRDESERKKAVEKIIQKCTQAGLRALGSIESPVVGGEGNIEYLLYLTITTPV